MPLILQGEGKKGWALLRASLHDPLLVLNVESDMRGGEIPLPVTLQYSVMTLGP